MRIISSFHDYYDAAQGYGQDRSILYFRKQYHTQIKNQILLTTKNINCCNSTTLLYDEQIIGFCNTIYPSLRLSGFELPVVDCFNIQQADKYINQNLPQKLVDFYYNNKIYRKNNLLYITRNILNKWFIDHQTTYNTLFDKFNTPIFLAHHPYKKVCKLITNPKLKNVQFYKIIDPNIAFQQIFMWLSNKTNPEKPIPKIDDVTMAEAKGFDKYSFRKDKKST